MWFILWSTRSEATAQMQFLPFAFASSECYFSFTITTLNFIMVTHFENYGLTIQKHPLHNYAHSFITLTPQQTNTPLLPPHLVFLSTTHSENNSQLAQVSSISAMQLFAQVFMFQSKTNYSPQLAYDFLLQNFEWSNHNFHCIFMRLEVTHFEHVFEMGNCTGCWLGWMIVKGSCTFGCSRNLAFCIGAGDVEGNWRRCRLLFLGGGGIEGRFGRGRHWSC